MILILSQTPRPATYRNHPTMSDLASYTSDGSGWTPMVRHWVGYAIRPRLAEDAASKPVGGYPSFRPPIISTIRTRHTWDRLRTCTKPRCAPFRGITSKDKIGD